MTIHQKQVHLKIKAKRCHLCDKRFFAKSDLRVHMMSHHQTDDHDMDDCDNCVTHLKKNHIRSRARTASLRRRARKEGTDSTAANMQDGQSPKKEAEDKEENSFAFKEKGVKNGTTGLNGHLIDMHMDMQLLSSVIS